VSQAFLYWGLIVAIMIVIGACFIHQAAEQDIVQETKSHDYTTREMLRTKEVYLLFIMLFTSCMSGLYLISMVKDIGVQLVG
ncbi:oxalate/formate antiport family MFS transporter, partial [Bacillus pseudomycoides]